MVLRTELTGAGNGISCLSLELWNIGTLEPLVSGMQLTTLDWVIVVTSIVLSFVPAIYLMRRAGSSTTEFFTSGRAAPWWLIGGSMVATTFSTDTPNLVTNLVRENGVANNWVWWAFLLTGMSTVFFYARMWRRSGVLTDLEFYEIRYAGKPAAIVRSEEHTSELQSQSNLVCRLLLEKKKQNKQFNI